MAKVARSYLIREIWYGDMITAMLRDGAEYREAFEWFEFSIKAASRALKMLKQDFDRELDRR